MRLALPGAGLPELLELAEALGAQARWQDGARLLEQQLPGRRAGPGRAAAGRGPRRCART